VHLATFYLGIKEYKNETNKLGNNKEFKLKKSTDFKEHEQPFLVKWERMMKM
jgi:hypothetical protein